MTCILFDASLSVRLKITRAFSLIVLVESLKDCSPTTIILCTFKPKIKKNYCSKSYSHMIVFYRRKEKIGKTNQIRGFPIEHRWVPTYYWYEFVFVRYVKSTLLAKISDDCNFGQKRCQRIQPSIIFKRPKILRFSKPKQTRCDKEGLGDGRNSEGCH